MSLFQYEATIFSFVLTKHEFWIYVAWSVVCTMTCTHFVEKGTFDNFEWDAATVMQYVLTFFVTFYNDRCYERFNSLYPACGEFNERVVLFVQEMNVSLSHPELHMHRVACTKYLLAIMYEYYLIVAGGKLTVTSWNEIYQRGLLTRDECSILQAYPTSQGTFVLTCWILFIVRDALVQSACWEHRSQQTVHIYNRLNSHIVEMLKACHNISFTMAMPIPFAYFHLMNVILMANVFVLATFPALFRTYYMILVFFVGLLVFMGLREVSCALADPFGQDAVDFPLPSFLNLTFDRAACLLVAFLDAQATTRVLDQIEHVEDFTDAQLGRACRPRVLHGKGSAATPSAGGVIRWSCTPNIAELVASDDAQNIVRKSLYDPQVVGTVEGKITLSENEDAQLAEEQEKLRAEKARGEDLRLLIADLHREREELEQKFLEVQLLREVDAPALPKSASSLQ